MGNILWIYIINIKNWNRPKQKSGQKNNCIYEWTRIKSCVQRCFAVKITLPGLIIASVNNVLRLNELSFCCIRTVSHYCITAYYRTPIYIYIPQIDCLMNFSRVKFFKEFFIKISAKKFIAFRADRNDF